MNIQGKNTILLADDEPTNLSVLSHILRNNYQVLASKIESMLTSNSLGKEDILPMLDQLEKAFKRLIIFLMAQKTEFAVKKNIKLDPEHIKKLLLEMKSYLSTCDTRCNLCFKENKIYFSVLFPDEINKIEQNIDDFEYEKALKIIQELRL